MKNAPWWLRVLLVLGGVFFMVLMFRAGVRKDYVWLFAHFVIQFILVGMATGFFNSVLPKDRK